MKQTKVISKILYYLCMFLAIGYITTFIYAVFCLLTGLGVTPYDQNQQLHINYPFSNEPFLNIDNNFPYIIFSFLIPMFLYGLFFWFSARLFKVFLQPRLFIKKNVKELSRFYIFNVFVPLFSVIIASFFVEIIAPIWGLVFVHFILGIFCYFLANIFKQGLQLQDEQDLYI